MALLDRPQPPPEDNDNNSGRDDFDVYLGDLSLNQKLEYETTKRMLMQASKEQLIEYSLKLLTFHMRYKNTQNQIVHEWGLPEKPKNKE